MGVTKQQLLNTVRQLKEYIDYNSSGIKNLTNYLAKNNTTKYTPTDDYHPATKKYVDDNSGGAISEKENNAITREEDGLFVPKTADTKVSEEEGNAIIQKEDGIYVESNANIKDFVKYQKFVNTELGYCHCTLEGLAYTPVVGEFIPWVKKNGTINITDGKFIVKSKQTVQITCAIGYKTYGSDDYADISYSLRSETHNKVLANYRPIHNGTKDEHPRIFSYVYTNNSDEDSTLGFYINSILSEDVLSPYSYLTIQEVNRQVVIDPVEHVNIESGIEDTPVGHILSFMGINAPNHYLVCDGTEYEIEKYPYLAQHFIDNFGSTNYFGGDGITTFAVPDLRERFLKGSENAGSYQEAGLPNITGEGPASFYWGDGSQSRSGAITTSKKSNDAYITQTGNDSSTTNRFRNRGFAFNASHSNAIYGKSTTVTPANISVLYCIKYEPTYYMQTNGSIMNTTVLYDQEISAVGEYTLKDNSNKYNAIIVEHAYTGNSTYQNDFVFPKFDGTVTYEMGGATAYIYFTITDNIFKVTKTSSEKITKIIGIKEMKATGSGGGSSSGGVDLSDEEIEQLVNNAYNEAMKETEGESV